MAGDGWRAQYSDGRVAASHSVEAWLEPDGLAIGARDGTRRSRWRYDEIRLLDQMGGDNQLRLARVDSAERLTILSPGALAEIEPRCANLRRSITHGPAWRWIALWSGSAIAALVVLFWIVVPFLARHSSRFVSPRLEADLGDRVADVVIRFTTASKKEDAPAECDLPAGRQALDRLAAPLIGELTLRNPPRIRVVNSAIVNAIALPGSQILLFKGLIDFAEDPNEIAGVLAHEFGHLALDHPTTLMIERGAVAFVIGLVAGDVFGVSVVAGIGATVLSASYGRDAESAADRRGSQLMTAAGLDLAPVGNFFNRLAAKRLDGDIPLAFLRSHPPSDERAKLFRSNPTGSGHALDSVAWKALKEICG